MSRSIRRYNITSSVLYHWRKQYSRGNPVSTTGEPTEEGAPAQSQPVPKKREIVASLKHIIRYIRRGYGLMKLPRSSFYYQPRGKSPEWMKAEADLRDRIEAICLEYTRYGYRRVTHELRHKDCQVNHKGEQWITPPDPPNPYCPIIGGQSSPVIVEPVRI